MTKTNAITQQAAFSSDLIGELHAFALRLAGNDSDAWDLVQDTIERALRKWPCGITREAAGAWFRVVLKNRHLDLRRSASCRTTAFASPEMMEQVRAPEQGELPLWRRVDPDVVTQALPRLSREQRQVLIMQWEKAMSLSEIARTLGIPQATAGVRAFRARNSLRRLLLDEPRAGRASGRGAGRRAQSVRTERCAVPILS